MKAQTTWNQYAISIFFAFLLGCIPFGNGLFAQMTNLGTPSIYNYDKSEYLAGLHNWEITMFHDRIYFANDNGLLEFDSKEWKLFKLPNETILWSITNDQSGRIYAGGQDELGYFFPDQSGQLVYHSIKERIPESYRKMEDVYDLVIKEDILYVRSLDRIYIITPNEVSVIDDGSIITFLAKANQDIYFNEIGKGIYTIQNNQKVLIESSPLILNANIIDILSVDQGLLILTEKSGAFLKTENSIDAWGLSANEYFKSNYITSSTIIQDSTIVIGTKLGGIVILNKQGKAFQLLNNLNGLQNNNIVSLSADHHYNLWAGTSNGIIQIMINSQFMHIYPDGDLRGAVYDMQIHNNKIYIGTNNGLYFAKWQSYYDPFYENSFKLVPNTIGQVWGLDTIDGTLLMGHHEGAFQIINDQAQKISPDGGYWKFLKFNEYVIGGNYKGVSLFEKMSSGWQFRNTLEGLEESSRILTNTNDQELWMSHPYRGIFKLTPSKDFTTVEVKKYGTDRGLTSTFRNHITSILGVPFVASKERIYQYQETGDKFVLNPELSEILGDEANTIRLYEDRNEDVWFITENDFGVMEIQDVGLKKEINKTSYPELVNTFVSGFESMYFHDDDNVFSLSNNKVLYFRKARHESDVPLSIQLDQVTLVSGADSVLFGGHFHEDDQIIDLQNEAFIPTLTHRQNDFKFEVSSNNFEHTSSEKYSFSLGGADNQWSTWSEDYEKEFLNLAPGTYTFYAKARNIFGIESDPIEYKFVIRPPWYKTKLALFIYGFLGMILLASFILIPRSKYKQKAVVLKQEKEKAEEEVLRLKNEKLATEINFKNQQLASSTMHIVQKNEVINKLKEELGSLKKLMHDPGSKREFKKIMSVLSDDQRLDDSWESFAQSFDQVHSNFLKRLKKAYPGLSPKDQKLCAYLRMNLSTKEIAPLMNISTRGVEISRYRLRKKLELDSNTNLNSFMMNF
jgi:ligand-binding sensor domain-containing protein/DNA-binding CsgD family transcriptional regulator